MITIGVPFYNNEATLRDMVRSVFAQTYEDWELILLDDGSSDSSLDIARSIRDDRVRVIAGGQNLGIGARRKEIVDYARGEFLAWQDADDLMHPDRLAIQLEYLNENHSCGLVDSWTYLIDTENTVVGISPMAKLDLNIEKVIAGPCMLNGAALGRIEMYRENEYDPTFRRAEDWEMWVRAYQTYEFGRIPQPLYFCRCVRANGRLFGLKTLKSLAYSRRVLLKHGPTHLGWRRSLTAVGEHYARGVARVVLSALGIQRLRPSENRTAISPDELQAATDAIRHILAVKVPGVDA